MKNNFSKYLKEAFGGASGGGAGSFAYAQQTGAHSWVNTKKSPHNRSQTGGPGDYNIQDIAQEEERLTHPAPKIKPFPLEQIDEQFVTAFVSLSQAENSIKHCLGINTTVKSNPAKFKLLQTQLQLIKEIKNQIKLIAGNIDKLVE